MSEQNFLQQSIVEDWKNRESIEQVSQNILKIAEFLNKFGMQIFYN